MSTKDTVNPDAIPVIALEAKLVTESSDLSSALVERSVMVTAIVNPKLKALLAKAGATSTGEYSWVVGLGEKTYKPGVIQALVDNLRRGSVASESVVVQGKTSVDMWAVSMYNSFQHLNGEMQLTPAKEEFGKKNSGFLAMSFPEPKETPWCYGGIAIKRAEDGSRLFLRAFTHMLPTLHGHNLNQRPGNGSVVDVKPVEGVIAIAIVDWAKSKGIPLVTDTGFDKLRELSKDSVAVWPLHGRPAEGAVAIGENLADSLSDLLEVPPSCGGTLRLGSISGAEIVDVGVVMNDNVVVHPYMDDLVRVAEAEPVELGLWPHQELAIGQILATIYGLVLALPTAMGKTGIALMAMALESVTKKRYRSLVVVEALNREQWALEELPKRWPGVKFFILEARKSLAELKKAEEAAGDEPFIVVTSYAMASSAGKDEALGEYLLSVEWDMLVADEAMGLRNTGKLHTALWMLRKAAKKALVLTGTPIEKSLNDVARLISWVRSDEDLFRGVDLEKVYNVDTEEGRTAFYRAVGALLFREDKDDIKDYLPTIVPETVELTPSRSEFILAESAEKDLKTSLTEVISCLELAARTDKDNPEYGEIKAALKAANGIFLSGSVLARQACSDPAALLGSNTAAAALLAGQGLIEAATKEMGTKRKWLVDFAENEIPKGEKILIFTEFKTVAQGIIADLKARGFRVGSIVGGRSKSESDKRAFQQGELDIMVCTSAGERGHNLQQATVLIHYDLPWLPHHILQRVGRVERSGANSDKVRMIFLVLKGTIEERIVAVVVARALKSMLALDATRGSDITHTDMGTAFGGLALVANHKVIAGRRESITLQVAQELFLAA